MPAASAAAIDAAAVEWNAAKPEKRTEFELASARGGGDAAEHIVAADHVGDPVPADQRGRRLTLELALTDDMRAAGNRSHCCGIAERSAERHRAKQRRIGRIEPGMVRDIGGVAGDGLLIVQDELRPPGRARRGEGQTRRFPGRLVRPRVGNGAIERRHR